MFPQQILSSRRSDMRNYSKVAPTFWTGATGRAIRKKGQDATVLALYLITNPHANMYGLYYLPLSLIAHETGIPLEGASKGLRSLFEEAFCLYDEVSEWVFVVEMAKYQILDGTSLKPHDHRVKGINKDYESFPNNPFLRDFYDRYKDDFHLKKPRDMKPLPSPFKGPLEPHRSQEQEQEQEKEQEQEVFESKIAEAYIPQHILSASDDAVGANDAPRGAVSGERVVGNEVVDEVESGNAVSREPEQRGVEERRQTACSDNPVEEGLSNQHAIHSSTLSDTCSCSCPVTDQKNPNIARVRMECVDSEMVKPPENAVRDPPFFLTRRKRKLTGWKLKAFDEFWEVFAYKKGRAEAADAWLDILELTPELARRIVDAAGREARARPSLVSRGQAPKWPQGWLSARRWEDWGDCSGSAHNRDRTPGKEVIHDTSRSRSCEEERAEYLESLREAIKRFM